MELRLRACDTVFFLDYPTEICLQGILARRGTVRTDLPWAEAPDEADADFVEFVSQYRTQSRPAVMTLLAKYPEKHVTIFSDRSEADAYLLHRQQM